MPPARIVMMGVSGSGKTTVGRRLAEVLGVRYVEGDSLHPPANVQRMAAGIALTDADRQGWLLAVAAELASPESAARGVVVACSALRRAYRDVLRAAAPDVRFVFLQGDERLLAQRLAQRQGHYMPPSLLPSQLATLEPPGDDESAITIDVGAPAPQIVDEVRARLAAASPG